MFIRGPVCFLECFAFSPLGFGLAFLGNILPQSWAIEKDDTGDIIGTRVLAGQVSSVAQWGW